MRLVCLLIATAIVAGAQPSPPADELLLDGAVYVLQIRDVAVLREVAELPAMFGKLTGGAVTLAMYPGEKSIVVLDVAGNRTVVPSRGFTTEGPNKLASASHYQEAKRTAAEGSVAWAYVDTTLLGPALKNADPMDALLNGPWKELLRGSHWMSAALKIDGKKLRLQAVSDGHGEARSVLPNLAVPRELGAASLWRDLGHSALLPHSSGGVLAENFLEIFFTGRNLGEEVFGKLQPEVRLVVARQEWNPKIGTPEVQYPAAALVFRADAGEDFGEVMEEAWQKAVGLTNFTRGQQALPGLILDRQTYGGVTFTYGAFSARNEKDREQLPVRFNLRPAIVHSGPYVILSTTAELARDLIDAVNREDGRSPKSGGNTVLEVTDPAGIAELLTVDKRAMVRQSVLEKGKKPAEAAAEVDQMIAWARKVKRARLSIDGCTAQLDMELN